jgi:hypothetical protein
VQEKEREKEQEKEGEKEKIKLEGNVSEKMQENLSLV